MNMKKVREILEWLFTPVQDAGNYRMYTGYEIFY